MVALLLMRIASSHSASLFLLATKNDSLRFTNDFFINRIKCWNKIKIFEDDCFASSCILINGENFGSTRRDRENIKITIVNQCALVPRLVFTFCLLFFAPYFLVVVVVNLESHSIIIRRDLQPNRETVSLSRSALKVSLLFLPISWAAMKQIN